MLSLMKTSMLDAVRDRRGVSAAEYAVMAVGLVALCAVAGTMVASWFGPTLNAVTGAIAGG